MAKKELENNDALPVEANNPPLPVEPVVAPAVVAQPLPYDPNRALDPGRPFAPGENLLGEIERIAHDAELAGNMALVGELQALKVKIGDLLAHLNEIEVKAQDHAKLLYIKIIGFFKK